MANYTPNSHLPYPIGTDRVMDGDDVIRALATALDGSNWATVNTAAPFGGNCYWARRSNMVTVALNLSASASWTGNQLIATLPAAARPLDPGPNLILLFIGQGGGVLRTVLVDVSGQILAGEGGPAGTPFWGTFTYPAGFPQP